MSYLITILVGEIYLNILLAELLFKQTFKTLINLNRFNKCYMLQFSLAKYENKRKVIIIQGVTKSLLNLDSLKILNYSIQISLYIQQ